MAQTVALVLHVTSGVAGVVLGPLVLYSAVRGHVEFLADAYHVSVLLVCVSAVVLAVLDFADLWWFLLVAAASYAFALGAFVAARRRRPGWLPHFIRGQGGAYIALWTAIVVVSVSGLPVVWALPTLIGTPLVEWMAHRTKPASPS